MRTHLSFLVHSKISTKGKNSRTELPQLFKYYYKHKSAKGIRTHTFPINNIV